MHYGCHNLLKVNHTFGTGPTKRTRMSAASFPASKKSQVPQSSANAVEALSIPRLWRIRFLATVSESLPGSVKISPQASILAKSPSMF